MHKLKIIISALFVIISTSSLFSVTIDYSAISSAFGNTSGSDLAAGSLIEVGTWDGSNFNSLEQSSAGAGAMGAPGVFTDSTTNLDVNGLGLAGDQLAFRWFDSVDTSGDLGLAFLDGASNSEWFLKAGDGSGSDTTKNSIDISNLVNSGSLVTGASIVEGSFGPETSSSIPSSKLFKTAPVPEPSTYALLLGVSALVIVMIRRKVS